VLDVFGGVLLPSWWDRRERKGEINKRNKEVDQYEIRKLKSGHLFLGESLYGSNLLFVLGLFLLVVLMVKYQFGVLLSPGPSLWQPTRGSILIHSYDRNYLTIVDRKCAPDYLFQRSIHNTIFLFDFSLLLLPFSPNSSLL